MPSAFNKGEQRRVRFPNVWAKIRAANPAMAVVTADVLSLLRFECGSRGTGVAGVEAVVFEP